MGFGEDYIFETIVCVYIIIRVFWVKCDFLENLDIPADNLDVCSSHRCCYRRNSHYCHDALIGMVRKALIDSRILVFWIGYNIIISNGLTVENIFLLYVYTDQCYNIPIMIIVIYFHDDKTVKYNKDNAYVIRAIIFCRRVISPVTVYILLCQKQLENGEC